MTALEKVREWLKTYPGYKQLKELTVDATDPQPSNGSVAPTGLVEVSRTSDILGNVTVTNQLNFTLYFVFAKAPDDDVGAEENAQWLMDFQDWVQAQSVTGKAPIFGDDRQGIRKSPKRHPVRRGHGRVCSVLGAVVRAVYQTI